MWLPNCDYALQATSEASESPAAELGAVRNRPPNGCDGSGVLTAQIACGASGQSRSWFLEQVPGCRESPVGEVGLRDFKRACHESNHLLA